MVTQSPQRGMDDVGSIAKAFHSAGEIKVRKQKWFEKLARVRSADWAKFCTFN